MTTKSITRLPLTVRAGIPAINVKDSTVWARDPRTQDAVSELPQGLTDALYDSIRASFWNVAKEIGRRDEFDYNVFNGGLSGGWLTIDATAWIEWLDCDDPLGADMMPDDDEPDNEIAKALDERAKFFRFADEITALMTACEDDFIKRINLLSRAIDVVMHLDSDGGLVIGTPEVYVVSPYEDGLSRAAFAALDDAERYSALFSDNLRPDGLLVCNAELAKAMISEHGGK